MNTKYRNEWETLYAQFEQWWQATNPAPMAWITAKRPQPLEALEKTTPFATNEDLYTNVDELSLRYRNYCRTHEFLCQAFPNTSFNIGAGSMALYLGSEPNFKPDTVWFGENAKAGWDAMPDLAFDENNYWWQKHLEIYRRAVELAGDDYLVSVPDIVENMDIIAAMRGPQDTCFDMMDYPDEIERRVGQVDDLYFKYYDPMYDLVKREGISSYTAFNLLGKGRVAKIQCDFSALMSPAQFRRFVQPSLAKQCDVFDHAIYHLDGPDEIRHVDALLEIDRLAGIQWTNGAGHPHGLDSCWFEPIYDKVRKAGKNLLIYAEVNDVDELIADTDRLLDRYGPQGFYIQYMVDFTYEQAHKLADHLQSRWKW